jgi:hypothetical protein
VAKADDQLTALRLELADVRSGKPSHTHTPRDGSPPFRCTSPYCEDLGSEIPTTSPSGREDPDKYRRTLDA